MTTWWLPPDVVLFRVSVVTLSTADYGKFDVLFHKQYFSNDWQQYSAGLEGNFGVLVFCISQESSGEKKEFLFKVLVIGDLGVGKTSIIKRYVHQFFSVHYRATISFLQKFLNVIQLTLVFFCYWQASRSISCIHIQSMFAYFQFFPSMISSVAEILITLYRNKLSSIKLLTRLMAAPDIKSSSKMLLNYHLLFNLLLLLTLTLNTLELISRSRL